ncbi:MAG TPA: DUF5691 domain-containing protein [Acidimicrobiia bacterium]|nr:DUF5691 domain-containing protein [Acidimicrobiia bacterium]
MGESEAISDTTAPTGSGGSGRRTPAPAGGTAAVPAGGTAWAALVAAALVGTARRGAPATNLGGIDVGGAGDPAAALLAAAAVHSAQGRAGRLPDAAPLRLPPAAEPDDRPSASAAALDVLELVLSGELPIPGGIALLAGQWLDGAARAGQRVPARVIPPLLDLASSAADLRPAVQAVAGSRGAWLAPHNPRWAWAVPPARQGVEPSVFGTLGRAERATVLETVRRIEPDQGRNLLASTWSSDPAADRAALLAVLAVGLGDGDEPFLEAALDDRSAAVRTVSAELLERLPESRRARRMAERLRPLVGLEHGRLSVVRPPEPDAAGRRDGISDAAPAGTGRSTWWLIQLVAGTPLSFWTEHLGLPPTAVVNAVTGEAGSATAGSGPTGSATAGGGRTRDADVLAGLERAVVAQAGRSEPDWGRAIFAVWPSPAILAALPPDIAAGELTDFLQGPAAATRAPVPGGRPVGTTGPAGKGGTRTSVAELYAAVPGPWPVALGDAVLDRYRRLGGRAVLEVQNALPALAARLDPSALPLVETWILALAGEQALRRRVQTLGHALSLRAVIQREFP